MKKKEKVKSNIIDTFCLSKPDAEETTEQVIKKKIVFKSYQESIRPYFSSPCMLYDMEDDEDFLNR